jgi:GT2 family glycosyltransferase
MVKMAKNDAMSAKFVGVVDQIEGSFVSGWVYNPDKPEETCAVEFILDGRVIHTVPASYMRYDVRDAGFGSGIAGFQVNIPLDITSGESFSLQVRLGGTHYELENSPCTIALPSSTLRWLNRKERVKGHLLQYLRRRLNNAVGDRTLSIVMPVYNVKSDWLREAIDSVLGQWCTKWELICVDDLSPNAEIRAVLAEYAAKDYRIRPQYLTKNGGIARATNAGLKKVTGQYVAFMDHDDVLEPDAVYHMLNAAKGGADLIYSDEITVSEDSRDIIAPQNRPAFSWDYYLSHPYFVHMVGVKAEIARSIAGLDETMNISADVDFILRALEKCSVVAHVPAVLYRWRVHQSSAGHTSMGKVTEATVGALNRHLSRVYPGAIATSTPLFNSYKVDFPDDHGKVLVVIPTKNRGDLVKTCVESIRATSKRSEVEICIVDHDSDDADSIKYFKSISDDCMVVPYSGDFNYPKINNYGVQRAEEILGYSPPYLLFANNDIEAIESGWLERMRGYARRKDVGIVGATLLYPDDTIQHSGVVLGFNGSADHAHKFTQFRQPTGDRNRGHIQSVVSTREYSAITAACMMMRTNVFKEVEGFDEKFAVGFNDTDLCLRVGVTGLKILNDGESVFYHYESATRSTTKQISHPKDDALLHSRWSKIIKEGDPFYSPLLNRYGISHQRGGLVSYPVCVRSRPGLVPGTSPISEVAEARDISNDNFATPPDFDSAWYLERYPDVAALGMEPLEHYLWIGAELGRKTAPSAQR